MINHYQVRGLLNELRKLSLAESSNKANIFLVLIEYELSSLLGASHLVDYGSVHIQFALERYLLNKALRYWTTVYLLDTQILFQGCFL